MWLGLAVFPAILDSCVLYPYELRCLLLEAAQDGLYRVHWSQRILDDTACNLVEDGGVNPARAERRTFTSDQTWERSISLWSTSMRSPRRDSGIRSCPSGNPQLFLQEAVAGTRTHFPAGLFCIRPPVRVTRRHAENLFGSGHRSVHATMTMKARLM